MSHIASRLSAVKRSASMVVSQAAKDLAATGIDVIDLGLGEPDFPAHAHITEAAFEGARKARMPYTASLGTPDLRKSIGTAYGLPPFFRISTATSEDVRAEAVKRIAAAVAKLEF